MRFRKIFSLDYSHQARTLNVSELGENSSGWTIVGVIHYDVYQWLNDFEATHPVYGWVRGNFEDVIEAKSKRAYEHFVAHHSPKEWDYHDI